MLKETDTQNAGQSSGVTGELDDARCSICGWPLDPEGVMCRRTNCSMRPWPGHYYDTARARREYGDSLPPERDRSDAGDGNQQPSDFRGDPGATSGQKDSTRDPVSPCSCCTSEITRLQGEVEDLKSLVTAKGSACSNWPCMACGYGHSAAMDFGYVAKLTAQLAKAEATLKVIADDMRHIALVAGQCSVEGPDDTHSLMAAAEAERLTNWVNGLDQLLLPSAAVAPEKDTQ